jgi:spore germination protein KB
MNLSAAQFRILVIFYSLGDTILVVPGSLTADSKQEAWIPAILGVGVGVFLVWMYIKLSSLYPNKTLMELNEAILGKWLGKFVSLLFVASTLLFCSQVLRGLVSNNSHYYSNTYACCSYFVYGNCDCRRSAWH